ncbi:hya [Mytilus coruscus]|uniref:Hyaluronidase n=1 Tax=Mytilus coruscus TaxID=42192 RepID=A0A6J8CK19_MYTCO|nr:hya [Mytilus coruscus]
MAGFINFLLWIYSLFFTDLLATKKTPDRRFDVIWNVPSEKCYTRYGVDLPLSEFDIRSNRNQSFSGDLVTLFNEPTPGLYPQFLPNGTAQNGGLPQLVNHTKHLMKTKLDIINKISDNSFNGFAVIDWEGWVPIFDRNEYSYTRSIYINKSEDLVSELHPEWNPSRVKLEARIQFETSASYNYVEWKKKPSNPVFTQQRRSRKVVRRNSRILEVQVDNMDRQEHHISCACYIVPVT